MHKTRYRFRMLVSSLLLAVASLAPVCAVQADKLPPLWGYGVKTCDAYLSAVDGNDQGDELQTWEYRRYEDWLTGFVSGLNLATGKDVLVGADVNSAMRRIRAWCGGHQKEDFFAGTMDLVRMLSGLR